MTRAFFEHHNPTPFIPSAIYPQLLISKAQYVMQQFLKPASDPDAMPTDKIAPKGRFGIA
jgi:hypothetical protein